MVSTNTHTRAKLVDISARTPPINPIVGELWVDTSLPDLPSLKVWTGEAWFNPLQSSSDLDRIVEIIALG